MNMIDSAHPPINAVENEVEDEVVDEVVDVDEHAADTNTS